MRFRGLRGIDGSDGAAPGEPVVGVPFWPESQIEELGIVTAPAGELVLIDFGLLRLWSGESVPVLDPGYVGEDVAATANSAVDMEILGDSPAEAGAAADLAAVGGRFVFDIPAASVDEIRDLVVSRAQRPETASKRGESADQADVATCALDNFRESLQGGERQLLATRACHFHSTE